MAWATYKEQLADVGWATEGEPPAYVGQAPKWFTHVHTESSRVQNFKINQEKTEPQTQTMTYTV